MTEVGRLAPPAPAAPDVARAEPPVGRKVGPVLEELELVAGRPSPSARDAVALLAGLTPSTLSVKERGRVVSATRKVLERLDLSLERPDLAALLVALTPPFLSDGTRPALLPFLSKALPLVAASADALDGSSAVATLHALATLPLDQETKAAASSVACSWAGRLSEIVPTMSAREVAGLVAGLHVLRGEDRAVMLELARLGLRRGVDVGDWAPDSAATLCRGLLGLRLDAGGGKLAGQLLDHVLPVLADRGRELPTDHVCDIVACLASLPSISRAATSAFLTGAWLQGRTLRLHELASIVRDLSQLALDDAGRAAAADFVQRAVVGLRLEDLSPPEAARILLGLRLLVLNDANGGALATAFALAVADTLVESAPSLPARDLAKLIGIVADLPGDADARARFTLLVEQLLPDVQRRAGKFGEEDRGLVVGALRRLGVAPPGAAGELLRGWGDASPAGDRGVEEPGGARAEDEQSKGDDVAGKTKGLSGQETMDKLGISRTELYRRLKVLRVKPPGRPGFGAALIGQLQEATARGESKASAEKAAAPARKKRAAAASAAAGRSVMPLEEAAVAVGISRSALNGWVRQEKELAKVVSREGRQVVMRANALPLLESIRDRRMASAPKSLQMAWAARKSGKSTTSPTPRKGRRAAVKAAATTAPTRAMTGAQAARELGVSRESLYALMRKRGVTPPGKAGFTPKILAELRAPIQDPVVLDSPAPRRRGASTSPTPAKNGDAQVLRLVAAVEKMGADFSNAVQLLVESQNKLIERMGHVTLKVAVENDREEAPSGRGKRRKRP